MLRFFIYFFAEEPIRNPSANNSLVSFHSYFFLNTYIIIYSFFFLPPSNFHIIPYKCYKTNWSHINTNSVQVHNFFFHLCALQSHVKTYKNAKIPAFPPRFFFKFIYFIFFKKKAIFTKFLKKQVDASRFSRE